MADGRVLFASTGTQIEYEYHIKDHLGNTRVTFKPGVATADAHFGTAILVQENHYYPYGMQMRGVAQGAAVYEDNPYQSGGKEKHAELGLDWYFYSLRTCNPETGRWLQQDPYDEFFSPYCAMGNNPANFTDPTGGFTGQTSHQQYGAGGTGKQEVGNHLTIVVIVLKASLDAQNLGRHMRMGRQEGNTRITATLTADLVAKMVVVMAVAVMGLGTLALNQ